MQGDTPWKKYLVESESDRQRSFEDRCLRKMFKLWGASAQQLFTLTRLVSAGSGDEFLTCEWFNSVEAFPVKLACLRFDRGATWTDQLKCLMGAESKMRTSAPIQALQDLREAYPGERVGLITRYVDFQHDIVVHTLPLEVANNRDFLVTMQHDNVRLSMQPLEVFVRMLRSAGVAWTSAWISKGAENG